MSNDQFSKPKRKFWNLNADSEVKAKVTGVKILTCMERSCRKACVCQMLKVYLNWYGNYEQLSKPKHRFWNLNADSEVNVKVTGVKFDMHGKVLSQGMCVSNMKGVPQSV